MENYHELIVWNQPIKLTLTEVDGQAAVLEYW